MMLSESDLYLMLQGSDREKRAAQEIRELRTKVEAVRKLMPKWMDTASVCSKRKFRDLAYQITRMHNEIIGILDEARANVALDGGESGTRRACDNPPCLKDYQHEGPCEMPKESA